MVNIAYTMSREVLTAEVYDLYTMSMRVIRQCRLASVGTLLALVACDPSAATPQPDGGSTPEVDASAPPQDTYLGEPIVVPPDQLEKWVWVPIDGTQCADGSQAGVGVNFTNKSRELVIWFQGNGVCYDLKSCTLFKSLLVGMGPEPIKQMFWGDVAQGQRGVFDRSAADNPFRNSNFVVLPHCGLDGHAADKESSYAGLPTYQQRGYRNATEALARIIPTFPDATRVVVAGFSAGGIGAMANYHKIATAFEAIGHPPPLLIDDAGPLLRKPFLSDVAIKDLNAGWGLDTTIGTFCPECVSDGAGAMNRKLAELHPGMKSSVLCAYSDSVVTSLYRLLNYDLNLLDTTKLRRGLDDLASWMASYQAEIAPSEQHVFFFPGDRHAALVLPLSQTPGLADFVQAQVDDASSWADVRP